MGRVVAEFVTLDGWIEEPQNWTSRYGSDDIVKFEQEEIFAAGGLRVRAVRQHHSALGTSALVGRVILWVVGNGQEKGLCVVSISRFLVRPISRATEHTQRPMSPMSIFETSRSPWCSRMLSVFRIVAGLIFISAGTMKLFDYPPNPVPGISPVSLMSQMGLGGVLEVVGGLAIVLGVLTRPVAFVLAGEMAVAYFQFHAPQAFWPTVNNGVPAVMYCFFFLYLTFAGAGAWSVDALIARSRSREVRSGRLSFQPSD